MKTKHYATAKAFRTALEERLLTISKKEHSDIQKLRRQVAFDRFLARLFSERDIPWVLKGGYVMELRVANARATRDVDLAMKESRFTGSESDRSTALFELVRKAAAKNLGDFFEFVVGAPVLELEAAPDGGSRFRVETKLDGRKFDQFLFDVGIGDVWIDPIEEIQAKGWLEFAGIKSPSFPVISQEQQFAEKLHAYTLPREGRLNSRAKDLVDMVLLISTDRIDRKRLMIAISETFKTRDTHPWNPKLAPPPALWTTPFETLAKECGISTDLEAAYQLVQEFVSQLVS